MAEFVKSGYLADIRRRHQARIDSGDVGGVREWFDIAFLLSYIDKLEDRSRRTVETYKELDALPCGSVVLTEQGGIWESTGSTVVSGLVWKEPGGSVFVDSLDLTLPAEVLILGS